MTYNKFREEVANNFKNINRPFENEYKALDLANKNWLEENEYQGEHNRLLVVVDSSNINNVAFFQFTNYNACKKFIKYHNEIIWSNGDDKIWNGDARIM